MRITRAIAFMTLLLAACTRDADVETPPKVIANGDLEIVAQPTIVLGASARGSSPIAHYDWTLVSSPSQDKVAIYALTEIGDVVELHTPSLAGLYVVAVTVTDTRGLTSDPDFVNVRLLPGAPVLKVAASCVAGCRSTQGGLEADGGATLRFVADVLAGTPEVVKWSATLDRDPADTTGGSPAVVTQARTATVILPAVALAATLTVRVTASASGAAEAVVETKVTIRPQGGGP